MKYIKLVGIFILLLYSWISYSQTFTIKERIYDNFPIVEIKIHSQNPNEYTKKDFRIIEDGKEIRFDLKKLKSTQLDNDNKNKNILILVENLKKSRLKFFKQVLKNSIPEIVKMGDKVNVAHFDVVRANGKTIFKMLPYYTDNSDELLNSVEKIKTKIDKYNENVLWNVDLWTAISDGIDELNSQFENNKFLIVLAIGSNNPTSSIKTIETPKNEALKSNIPIFFIQKTDQRIKHWKNYNIGKDTYGNYVRTRDYNVAADSMIVFMNNALKNHRGSTYKLTYRSSLPKDGKNHYTKIYLDNIEKEFNTTTKKNGFFKNLWIKHKIGTILFISFFLFGLTLLAFLFIGNNNNDNKSTAQYTNEKLPDTEEIDNKYHRKYSKKDYKTIIKEMKNNGSFPKLTYNINGHFYHFTIKEPFVSIGSSNENENENDLVLNHESVCKKHAIIFFKNRNYYIDKVNELCIVKVKGNRINKSELLRHSNKILLGNLELIFTK